MLQREHGSPLSQGRGLKHAYARMLQREHGSPLSQGRGLKPRNEQVGITDMTVAPLAGAWIETFF